MQSIKRKKEIGIKDPVKFLTQVSKLALIYM